MCSVLTISGSGSRLMFRSSIWTWGEGRGGGRGVPSTGRGVELPMLSIALPDSKEAGFNKASIQNVILQLLWSFGAFIR